MREAALAYTLSAEAEAGRALVEGSAEAAAEDQPSPAKKRRSGRVAVERRLPPTASGIVGGSLRRPVGCAPTAPWQTRPAKEEAPG
jgi:hypothetical protein